MRFIGILSVAMTAANLSGCLPGKGFLSQKGSADAEHAVQAEVTSDSGGIVTARIVAGSKAAQTVTASSENAAIAATSVTFPPGSLAINTDVTIQEGASLATQSLAIQLGLPASNALTSAGSSVVVSPSTQIDAAAPFTVSLQLANGSSLTDQDLSSLVIVYKVWHAGDHTVVIGLIPHSALVIGNGTVQFQIDHFGQYQAAYTSEPVATAVQAPTTTAPLTQVAAAALPQVSWQAPLVNVEAQAKMLDVTTSVAGLTDLANCAVALSKTSSVPFAFTATIGASSTGKVSLGSLAVGTYFAQVTCSEKNGRTTSSPWSNALTYAAVSSAPAATTPSPTALALTSVYPGNQAALQSPFNAPIVVNFNQPVVAGGPQDLVLRLAPPSGYNSAVPQTVLDSWPVLGGIQTYGNSQLTLSSYGQLPLLSTVVAELPNPIKAVSGSSLSGGQAWSFTTGDGHWTGNEVSINASIGGGTSVPAFGANGDAVNLVWNSTPLGPGLYAFYIHTGDNHWQSKQLTSSTPVSGSVNAAVDAFGNVTVSWIESQASVQYLYAIRRTVSGSGQWDASPTVIDSVIGVCPSYCLANPQLAGSPSGAARLAWSRANSGSVSIQTAAFMPAVNAWEAASHDVTGTPSPPLTGSISYLSLAMNDANDFVIAFAQSSYSYASAMLKHGTINMTGASIAPGSGNINAIRAFVDSSGNGSVVQTTSATFSYLYVSRCDTNAWTSPLPLTSGSTTTLSGMNAAVSQESLYVVWYDNVNGVQLAHLNAGSWPTLTVASSAPTGQIRLALDPAGDAAIAWDNYISSHNYYAAYVAANAASATAVSVKTTNTIPMQGLSATIDARGNAMLLAVDPSTAPTKIVASRLARASTGTFPNMSTILTPTAVSVVPLTGSASPAMSATDALGRTSYLYFDNNALYVETFR